MRTRNSENPKPAAAQKKTPPAKRSAASKSGPAEATETTTPKSSSTKRTRPSKATPAKTPDKEAASSAAVTPTSDSKMETPVEETKFSAEDDEVTPPSKEAQPASTTKRVTRKVVRKKVVRKTSTSGKAASVQKSNLTEPDKDKTDELPEEKTTSVYNVESPTKDEAGTKGDVATSVKNVEQNVESPTKDEAATKGGVATPVKNVESPTKDEADIKEDVATSVKYVEVPTMDEAVTKGDVESPDHKEQREPAIKEDVATSVKYVEVPTMDEAVTKGDVESPDHKEQREPAAQAVEDIVMIQEKGKTKVDAEESPVVDSEEPNRVSDLIKIKESEDPSLSEMNEAQQEEEEKKNMQKKEDEPQDKLDNLNEVPNEETENKDDEDHAGEEMVEYGEDEAFIDPSEDDFREDDGLENAEQVKTSAEEHMELDAALKERKIRRELEVFVGGLDHDVVEDDVKKAFEKVGEVVEVRLLQDSSTNRNRGFAFVRFANKEHVNRALSEMKNPVIRGKRCGTAPSEDNDVLFLGNICNSWTKEAIKQKLQEYGIEGVESITLVQDPRHKGLSRGFCFVQFACHADAMIAYKRLQKPDANFGHDERSAKVAFAEPLREPDPQVMAKVKSVFVDGLPPHWDEDRVRESFKCYGEIERITLARNMPSAKRKDFGFVDFSTHEAAIACIEDVNTRELGNESFKARVRARLSNPMPKTQAVKGGMCGGFRIGRGGVIGRGFGRGNRPFDRPNIQYGRPGFYQHGQGQHNEPIRQYPDFQDRRQFGLGGRRVPWRGSHLPSSGSHLASSGSGYMPNNFSGPRQGLADRGQGRPPFPLREPFHPEDEGYARPFMGRYMDDPYNYNDRAPGMKRPFYDPGYMEPSRVRPRLEYSHPARGNHYRDTYGAGSSMYSSGYYGPDYVAGQYPPFRGNDRSFRGGYHY